MLTQVQLAAKRTERTMTSRAKAKGRATAHGLATLTAARNRRETEDWLLDLGNQQKDADAIYAQQKQARESSRAKAAMSKAPPKGFIGRIKAFFRRTP